MLEKSALLKIAHCPGTEKRLNHPNFALPSTVQADVPGAASSRFGTLQSRTYPPKSRTSPPTGLPGAGLSGDSSPRVIAFQGKIEF
jgi:hypothetical protein